MVRLELLFALVATVSACSSVPDPTPSTSPPTIGLHDPAVTAKLREVSRVLSGVAGNDTPAAIKAVASSDHQAAETVISGADINDHAPVYVVQLTGGSFTVPHGRPGVTRHVGSALTVTFDQKTMRVTDVGYDEAPADLTRIDKDVVDLLAVP